jgi:hypothetical protein
VKLNLSHHRGVEILSVAGPVSAKEAKILQAGIGKIFRSGKNRIILELEQEQEVPLEVLRELAALDLLARELSGRIVLAGVGDSVRKRIENFAQPPVIPTFRTRQEALQFFENLSSGDAEDPAAVKAAVVAATVDPEQAKAHKEQIRQNELSGLGELRQQITTLENENKMLMEQLQALVIQRKGPPGESASQERIRDLEARLDDLLKQLDKKQGGPAGAAPSKG